MEEEEVGSLLSFSFGPQCKLRSRGAGGQAGRPREIDCCLNLYYNVSRVPGPPHALWKTKTKTLLLKWEFGKGALSVYV